MNEPQLPHADFIPAREDQGKVNAGLIGAMLGWLGIRPPKINRNEAKRIKAGREFVVKPVMSQSTLGFVEMRAEQMRQEALAYRGPQSHRPCANLKKLRRRLRTRPMQAA